MEAGGTSGESERVVLEGKGNEKVSEGGETGDPSTSNLCEECKVAVAKYKCPRCGVRTCSLKCVNSHKEHTKCSGLRDKTAYKPMDELGDREMFSGR